MPVTPADLSSRYSTVVSATRSPRETFDTPAGTTVVGRADVARRPGASTAELLRDQPGIWSNGESFFNVTPNVRGALGNQNLLLIDGARVNTAVLFAGPNSFFQTIDAENLDRLEVVRGPGSVMWGSDALGGTIQAFTTPPPDWNHEGTTWTAREAATLGSVDALQRLRGEAGVSTDRFRARVGFTAFEVGDLHSPGPLGTQSPSSWGGRALDGRVDVRLRSEDVLTLQLQGHEDRAAQNYELAFSRPTVSDSSRWLALLRYDSVAPLPGVRSLSAWGYVQRQRGFDRQLNDGKELSRDVVTWSGDVQARSRATPWLGLTYGVHVHGDTARSENAIGATHVTRSFPEGTWLDGAAFVLGEARPSRWLSVLVGARADVIRLRSFPDQLSVPAGLPIDELRLDTTTLAPTGSIGLVGHILPWLNVVVDAGRGFRAPNLNDETASGPFRNGYNYPSPGLSPEASWNAEGGVRIRMPHRLTAAVTGWYTWYKDLISGQLRNPDLTSSDCVHYHTDPDGACAPDEHIFVKTNAGAAHTTGLEAQATLELPEDLSFSLAGTYLRGRIDTTNVAWTAPIPANATLSARYAPASFYLETWTRLVSAISAADLSCSRIATDGGLHTDPRNARSPTLGTLAVSADGKACSGRFPGYVTVGVRGGVHLAAFAELELSLNNLTNKTYRDLGARWDAGGFGVIGTLTLHEPR